ncbi:hypothetical protein ACKKBG_A16585 [Auxenochlorella protothecoides x Auxenochlorella symbiontica]|uniref:Protein Asterix n=1 Tax=Auxenochlorella protothecoides TaxID=3075 RepID=A0A1D1ZRP5_AUXPR
MPLQPKVAGDPRRPNDIVKYKRHVVKDDDLPDTYLMAALCLGMAALLLKGKMAAWTAIICILSSLANYGVKTDLKQLLSSSVFVLFGTGAVYLLPENAPKRSL